jgi:hypothetical protein
MREVGTETLGFEESWYEARSGLIDDSKPIPIESHDPKRSRRIITISR